MRSLFWRVFLAFIVASVANSVVLMFAERAFQPTRDLSQEGDGRGQMEEAFGRTAMALADVAGPEAVARALNDGDNTVEVHIFGDGLEMPATEYANDQEAQRLLAEAKTSDRGRVQFTPDGRFLIAKHVRAGDREVTIFVNDHTVDPLNPIWNPYARGAIAMIVSGLTCFGLVLTVTGPLKRLSATVDRYGKGDLRARYGKVRWRDEIGDLGVRFDDMADRVQKLVDAQQRLLRDVSHELRSPLARLQLALGIARNSPQEISATLDRVENEANRLNDLIKELLTLSRLETTHEEEWETIELNRMLTMIIDDARFEAQSRDVTVEFAGLDRAEVRGSANLLYRALENVVRNAVKYSAAKSVVEVTLQNQEGVATDSGYLIRIRDHGPGIPAEELNAVLQPFVRSTEAKTKDGVGLGLAISERILRQARGALRLANAPDGGLLVDVLLPRFEPARKS